MPTITVDRGQHVLYYEDTGALAVSSQPYTTLVIVHGSGFHSGVFRRLLTLAQKYHVRLVLVNRREYPHSSPFTDEDLDKLRSEDDAVHIQFAKERAEEIATFMKVFVEKEDIPRATPDGRHGGLVLMGWSSGASQTISLLSYADMLPAMLRKSLEPYLRSYIIFEVARSIHGLPAMGNTSSLLQDLTLRPEERASRFCRFVSLYYIHKSVTSGDENDLEKVPDPVNSIATIDGMSADEVKDVTYTDAIERSEVGMRTASRKVHTERVRKALFDDKMATLFPLCGVDIIYGECTTWTVIDGVWKFQDLRKKADEEGVKGRPLRIFMFPKANHFPHWDMPEETMRFFAEIVHSKSDVKRKSNL